MIDNHDDSPDDDFNIVLYYNDKQQLTEFNIGDLAVYEDGRYYTPIEEAALLNGTFMINSVCGWCKIELNFYEVES